MGIYINIKKQGIADWKFLLNIGYYWIFLIFQGVVFFQYGIIFVQKYQEFIYRVDVC